MLVSDARSLSTEFDVDTVAICSWLEELARDCNGCWVGVLRIMYTFGLRESTSGKFALVVERKLASRLRNKELGHAPR